MRITLRGKTVKRQRTILKLLETDLAGFISTDGTCVW